MVSTWDFETYSACPTDTAQIDYSPTYSSFPTVKGWVIPTAATADFFDTCGTTNVDVPQNQFGYQLGHSAGGYVGLHTWLDSGYSKGEYVETRLSQPFIAGHKYYLAFYVSNTIWNAALNFIAIDSMGMYLSDTMVNDFSAPYLDFVPQLASVGGSYITDTASWLKVQGLYAAAGGEEWAILGKFITHTPVAHVYTVNNGPAFQQAAYMYIDDVCITDVTDPIPLPSSDTTVCTSVFPLTLHSSELSDDYVQWNNGDTSHDLVVNDTGTYWYLKVNNCTAYVDTIRIHPKTIMDTVSHPLIDTTLCSGVLPIILHSSTPGDSIVWNTGATTTAIYAPDSGLYVAASFIDCTWYIDSFHLNKLPSPIPLVTQLDSLLSTGTYAAYQWNYNGNPINGANSQTYIATQSGSYNVMVTDTNGCTGLSDTVIVTVTTGISTISTSALFLVPNPVHDILEVNGDIHRGDRLVISDAAGRILYSGVINTQSIIDVHSFSAGIYIYGIYREGMPVLHGKLLKE
jgi:hypothetical protein